MCSIVLQWKDTPIACCGTAVGICRLCIRLHCVPIALVVAVWWLCNDIFFMLLPAKRRMILIVLLHFEFVFVLVATFLSVLADLHLQGNYTEFGSSFSIKTRCRRRFFRYFTSLRFFERAFSCSKLVLLKTNENKAERRENK